LLLLYLVLLLVLADGANQKDLPNLEPSRLVFLAQLFNAVLAFFNLYLEFYVLPRGTKEDDDDFFVTYGPLGRWVYLTHQTIGALAVHSSVSAVAPLVSKRLAFGTYAASPLVGAAGIFVTVQYFNLVYSHPDFEKQCQVWAARGVRFGFIDCLRHSLPLVVAAFDILFKQREALRIAMPSSVGLVRLHLLYVTFLLAVFHLNYAITRRWPYGLMKDFGVSVTKWSVFVVAQGCILSLSGFLLSLLASLSFW